MSSEIKEENIRSFFENYCLENKIEPPFNIQYESLNGDASLRSYFRVSWPGTSYILCYENPNNIQKQNLLFIEVQSFLDENKILVPKIYSYNLLKGFILQEDLSDETLLFKLANAKSEMEEYSLYQKSIEILITMQKINVNGLRDYNFTRSFFDVEKLMAEVNLANEYFLKGYLKKNNSEALKKINNEFLLICNTLSKYCKFFVHRDFHSRNIMFHNHELYAIDFQDARTGSICYDLVSLIEDCYYLVSENNKKKLLQYYWQSSGKDIFEGTYDEFINLYNLTAIQRLYKAIGSFSFIFHSKGDLRYLKYIGFAFEKLRSFLVAQGLNNLKLSLCELYYGS